MNIIFAGTPEISQFILKSLINSKHNIKAVLTQPNRASGRGKKVKDTAVKITADEYNIPVFQSESLKNNDELFTKLSDLKADIFIVVAYGLIIPECFLTVAKYGTINIHVSLLPKLRGAAPIQRAILNGDSHTGITIMQMDKGLDTGDILATKSYKINENETSLSLHDNLMKISPDLLLKTLDNIENNNINRIKQDDSQSTYAKKLTKQEALVNWNIPAEIIHRNIKGYNPFPIAYTFLNDIRVKILASEILDKKSNMKPGCIVEISKKGIEVSCIDYNIMLTIIQLPNKKAMKIADMLNGNSLDRWDNKVFL